MRVAVPQRVNAFGISMFSATTLHVKTGAEPLNGSTVARVQHEAVTIVSFNCVNDTL